MNSKSGDHRVHATVLAPLAVDQAACRPADDHGALGMQQAVGLSRCQCERQPHVEMARRKGTLWQREKGPLCRVVVATWPDGAERREATSRRVPINACSSVERGPSGSVGRP